MRHGTYTGCKKYKCPCTPCRQWGIEDRRARRARLAATVFEEIPHGLNGYNNYFCRCETCKAAKRVANAKRTTRPADTEAQYDSAPVRAV